MLETISQISAIVCMVVVICGVLFAFAVTRLRVKWAADIKSSIEALSDDVTVTLEKSLKLGIDRVQYSIANLEEELEKLGTKTGEQLTKDHEYLKEFVTRELYSMQKLIDNNTLTATSANELSLSVQQMQMAISQQLSSISAADHPS